MIDMTHERNFLHPDWPDAKWNISGLFVYRPLVNFFTQMMKNHGMAHVINSFHGAPDLLWNGGRVNANVKNYPDAENYFKALNSLGIGVYLTFSNVILEKKHLEDEESNRLLDCLDEKCGLNGVIVVNDLIADYIRKKKPGLKLISSVVKNFIENPKGDIDWYKRMEDRFDQVVVHTDHMFDLDLLDKLDRKKSEILITEGCIYKCPNRAHHQTLNSVFNIAQYEDKKKADEIMEEIKVIRETKCAGGGANLNPEKNTQNLRTCYLDHEDVKTIYDMGFRNLKISGRRMTIYGMAWNILNWVFDPDQAHTFARILYSRIEHKVKTEYTQTAREKGVI